MEGKLKFEVATPERLVIDESVDELGTGLRLPPWFESARDRIEEALPPIEAPAHRRPGEAA